MNRCSLELKCIAFYILEEDLMFVVKNLICFNRNTIPEIHF